MVAGLGILFPTLLGTAIGIARLSKNFLVERLASGYVELIRNVPLLSQLLFWYNAVLKALPDFANGFALSGGVLLNNRGLYAPRLLIVDGWHIVAVLACVIILGFAVNMLAGRSSGAWRSAAVRFPVMLLIVFGLPRSPLSRWERRSNSNIRRPAGSTSAAGSKWCRSSSPCCSAS